MSTRVILDPMRPVMTEMPFDASRLAQYMTASTVGKNTVYQWPGTGSYTLYPINFSDDYVQTDHWEALKFRLSDCQYDSNWWTEKPEQTNGTSQWDWFFHNVVVNTEIPAPGIDPLVNMANFGNMPIMPQLLFQSSASQSVMASTDSDNGNQGYYLHFYVEGRGSASVSCFFDFWFGQFILRININGLAQLWQSIDKSMTPSSYAYVQAFDWAEQSQVADRWHNVTIMPHGRNKIEFITGTGSRGYDNPQGKAERNTYTLPGLIPLDSNGLPIITLPNNWALSVSLQYLHHIQVGSIAFYDGGDQVSQVYDNIIDPGFICNQNISFSTTADVPNGTHITENIVQPTFPPTIWVPPAQKMLYFMGMSGLGDIIGADGTNGSSITPEFYSYAITKPAGFLDLTLTPTTWEALDLSVDTGETPEAERATIKFDNTAGVIDAYTTRSQVGVVIIDPSASDPKAPDPTAPLTLFEGVGYGQSSTESTGDNIIDSMTMPCRGMVDQLVRAKWTGNNPDFGNDPNMPGKGWLMGDVIRRCFNQAGFDDSQVVIEEESTYLSQFRCWMGQQGGGPTSNNSPGEGHELQGIHTQWQPNGETAVNEFLDWLLRDILGWHWVRQRQDRKWHVYRRPNPTNATDVSLGKFIPKVGFYRTVETAAAMPDNIPGYSAAHIEMGPINRPTYTTIEVQSMRPTTPTIQELKEMIAASNAAGAIPQDAAFTLLNKVVWTPYDNPKGYVNPLNNPPDLDSPDYLGMRTVQKLSTSTIGMNDNAMLWIGRRLYDDNTHGYIPFTFESDWGDRFTYNLRKYDCVLLQTRKFGTINCTIDRIEPAWNATTSGIVTPRGQRVRRAKYRVYQLRLDCPPPR